MIRLVVFVVFVVGVSVIGGLGVALALALYLPE